MSKPVTIGIASAVLQQDTQATRFEKFCADLISDIEGGVQVLPTSHSWDRGRDARSAGPGPRIVACCTLMPNVDEKIRTDLRKLIKGGLPVEKVYVCISQPVSEHTIDAAVRDVQELLPHECVVDRLTGKQLAKLASELPRALWAHYRAELEDNIRALHADDGAGPGERTALLLALATIGNPDSASIRDASYAAVILNVLSDGKFRTTNEIGRDVAALLKLGASLPKHVVQHHLTRLEEQGKVKLDGDRYSITASGRDTTDSEEEAASIRLSQGKEIIRKSLVDSTGIDFTEPQYRAIWLAIQEKLAHFFYSEGHRMLSTIQRVLAPTIEGDDGEGVAFFVREMATAAGRTCSEPVTANLVEQAILGIFADRCGQAYEWLSTVCANYVVICMLGLEATSGSRIKHAIADMHAILDTDVLLELLGEGEPFHDSAQQLVEQWRALGGTLLLARSVCEEIAHHAWIAEIEREEIGERFLASELERRRYVKNVFMRSYGWLKENNKRSRIVWKSYIRQFQGQDEADCAPAKRLLMEEHRFQELPDGDLGREPGISLWERLRERAESRGTSPRDTKIRVDKARRDARLLAGMIQYSRAFADTGTTATCVLVTSSGRLKSVSTGSVDPKDLVLSLAATLYLLTMIPGVSIGLTALRSVLFDQELVPRTNRIDMVVLRSIREADYDLPWAKQASLRRDVQRRLLEHARNHSEQPDDRDSAQRYISTEDGRATLADVMAKALDAHGASPRIERDLEAALVRIKELEERLAKRSK